jgi:hypothetical protein
VAHVESELMPGGLYLFGADRDAGVTEFTALEAAVVELVRDARDSAR